MLAVSVMWSAMLNILWGLSCGCCSGMLLPLFPEELLCVSWTFLPLSLTANWYLSRKLTDRHKRRERILEKNHGMGLLNNQVFFPICYRKPCIMRVFRLKEQTLSCLCATTAFSLFLCVEGKKKGIFGRCVLHKINDYLTPLAQDKL